MRSAPGPGVARHLWLVALAPILVAAPLAQALPAHSPGQPQLSPLVGSPRQRLEELAARQINAPDQRAVNAPLPPGAAAALAAGPTPEQAARPEAREDLLAVLERHAALTIDPAPGGPPEGHTPPSGDEAFAATRLYVQARQKFLDDDYPGAIADLENALAIDPDAPTLWLLLGESRLRAGRDQEGMDAIARAVSLGLEHPRPLLLLCTWQATRGNTQAAIHLGARAVAAQGMQDDPALLNMAWAALADALHAGGYLSAAARAYTLAFDLPASFPSGTSYSGELSNMYRGAWDALFRAAGAAVAIEDWLAASDALAAAARFSSVDDARALPPRVLASMRLGRPAAAALALLDTIESRGSAVDHRTLRLIRHLRDHSDAGPLLAAALTELDARVRGRSPSIEASLALAVAAGLPDGLDRGPLVEALHRFPSNLELATALLASFSTDELDRALAAAAAVADANPTFAQTIADAMIAGGLRTPAVIEALRASIQQPGADILLARLLTESARFDEARAILEQTGGGPGDPVGPADPDHAAARRYLAATIEALASNTDAARRIVDSWPTPTSDAQRLLLVRALQAVGNTQAAADAAGDPQGADEPSRALLWQACQGARSRADYDTAERLAFRLVEADPYSENGYAVLIGLYSPAGPKASQPRLGETVRSLRASVPDSPLLRFLSARELAQTGRLAEADARLRALAQDKPTDDAVLRALIDVWNARATRESTQILWEADAFLSALAQANPFTSAPPVALAAFRLAQDRPDQAIEPVAAWLDRGLIATAEDRNRLRSIIDPLLRRATSTPDPRHRAALLQLWQAMDSASIDLDPPMHQARIVLLSQLPPFDDAALLNAASLAADQVPAMDPGAFIAPAGRVLQGGRPDLALALLKAGAARPVGLTPEDAARWAGLIAQHGDADDLRDFFAITTDPATLTTILQTLPGGSDQSQADINRLRADLAYSVAAATRVLDRPIQAGESFLLLALELFPEHHDAANDLGYQWADRGINLDQAARLLEMAHRLQPDEPNILDSLGWLRYKQGRLTDLLDASGAPIPGAQGAISLLERAAAALTDTAGPVTLDQLGDALWRAGRHADALARWHQALPRAHQTLDAYTTGQAPASLIADAQQRLDRLLQKIAAAESDRQPPVAPLGEGVSSAR